MKQVKINKEYNPSTAAKTDSIAHTKSRTILESGVNIVCQVKIQKSKWP